MASAKICVAFEKYLQVFVGVNARRKCNNLTHTQKATVRKATLKFRLFSGGCCEQTKLRMGRNHSLIGIIEHQVSVVHKRF